MRLVLVLQRGLAFEGFFLNTQKSISKWFTSRVCVDLAINQHLKQKKEFQHLTSNEVFNSNEKKTRYPVVMRIAKAGKQRCQPVQVGDP